MPSYRELAVAAILLQEEELILCHLDHRMERLREMREANPELSTDAREGFPGPVF